MTCIEDREDSASIAQSSMGEPMASIRKHLEARERQILAPQAAKSADTRGRLREEPEDDVRPVVPARPRSHRPLQGVSPAQAQDAGVLRADRRSLPHAADTHARGRADISNDREGAAAARGAHRSDRSWARSRAHAVRACGRARARRAHSRRIQSLSAEPAHRRRARARSPGVEPDVGSARRHRASLEGEGRIAGRDAAVAAIENARRADCPRRRSRCLRQSRHRRCAARGDSARGRFAEASASSCSARAHRRASAAW